MLQVVKSNEGKPRKSFGVAFEVPATGPQSMMTKMPDLPRNFIPFHSHPNEQIGYLLFGRLRVLTRDAPAELTAGDTYGIPAKAEHSLEIIEASDAVQAFTLPRADFR